MRYTYVALLFHVACNPVPANMERPNFLEGNALHHSWNNTRCYKAQV
ncbi:hypothetical protein HMPREF1991_01813 [Hoylesella loescheii DSM 19665 = JCM 12249 = ATCC 15930]|uniref:Uncharacterized protein n=1 Tax=Hoylesella loescheii DSM 19665 = JCM 12249 = ATCC 15930 TaxID=1122985 RepID=A0A069QJ94_HOYLO|nr:hypothetical protein HMPREF1991_01813 [Hoylesella loescheii DSM 19665 = JCM 12249 = ATCC 15930]